MADESDELIFNQKEAAEIAGVNQRTLRSWGSLDIPPPYTPGRRGKPAIYPARAFVAWLIDRRTQELMGMDGGEPTLGIEGERLRLTKAQADKAELEVAQLLGTLIPVERVLAKWQRLIINAKTRLLGLPTKIAPVVIAATSLPEIESAIKALVHESLRELASDGLPDRTDGPLERESSDVDAAAETDDKPVGRPASKAKSGKRGRARAVAD